jgi:hypothetical protein
MNERNIGKGASLGVIWRFFRAPMPPQWSARRENCLSASARVFSRQRSEDVHGRKKILNPDEDPFPR